MFLKKSYVQLSLDEGRRTKDVIRFIRVQRSNQANVAESSNQSRRGSSQLLRKVKDGSIKSFLCIDVNTKRSKRTRNPTTAVHDVGIEGASSSQQVEDTSHLHPSNDNKHPTTSEIPSDSVNKGLSGEPASQVQAGPSDEEGRPDPQLVYAELQGACDADLTAADGFETTYLQPLKIIDAVLEKITDIWAILVVHPYAHAALSVLSAASKIIIAQAQRDESILRLLKKLAEVYCFMTQDDSLEKFELMSSIVGKIVHQTLECARFIGDYSQTTSFCELPSYRILYMNLMLCYREENREKRHLGN
ncbi:hypothetical protein BDR06DRAFT_1015381 [Suillus hirtellus]|nr:hypothetical protein BDR06DRAFT_1015381 [Suillus hirtellus]